MMRGYKLQIAVSLFLFALFATLGQLEAAPNTSTFTKSLPGKSASRSVVETDEDNKARSQDTYQIVVDDGDFRTSGNLTGQAVSAAAATVNAFEFDTSVNHTAGNIFEIRNNNVLKFGVNYAGTITTGGYTFTNGLTNTSGSVALGGTLAVDTTVATSGHSLDIGEGDESSNFNVGAHSIVSPATPAVSNLLTRQVSANNRDNGYVILSAGATSIGSQNFVDSGGGYATEYFGQASFYNKAVYGAGQYLIDLYGYGPTKTGELTLHVNEPTESLWTLDGDRFLLSTPTVTLDQNTNIVRGTRAGVATDTFAQIQFVENAYESVVVNSYNGNVSGKYNNAGFALDAKKDGSPDSGVGLFNQQYNDSGFGDNIEVNLRPDYYSPFAGVGLHWNHDTNSREGSILLNVTDSGSTAYVNADAFEINAPLTKAPKLGDPGAKPTCDSTTRGTIFHDQGGAGVADTLEICAKNSSNTYAWYAMATIP